MAAITHVHDCDIERRDDPTAAEGDFRECFLDENESSAAHNWALVRAGIKSQGGKIGNTEYRGLFLFDLKAFIPASATITAAVWRFYVAETNCANNHAFYLFRCERNDWLEVEATWYQYKTGSSWTHAGGDMSTPSPSAGYLDTTGWKNVNVLSIVAYAWPRDGICTFFLKRTDHLDEAAYVTIPGKDYYAYDPALINHLRITYTLDGRTFQAMLR